MAFGTSSKMFTAWAAQAMGGSGSDGKKIASTYGGLGADNVKVALYGNSGTPDNTAAYASTGYNTGAWATANQVTDTNWPAVGIQLTSPVGSVASNVFKFDAADTPSSGSVTLANVYGCLVYDDTITATNTVADQGVSYHYFGGAQSVSAGTFTVVWNASGLFQITV